MKQIILTTLFFLFLLTLLLFGCTSIPSDSIRGIKFSDFNVIFVKSDTGSNPPMDLYKIDFKIQNVGKDTTTDSFGYKLEVDQGYTYTGQMQLGANVSCVSVFDLMNGCPKIFDGLKLLPLETDQFSIYFWVNKGTKPKYLIIERGNLDAEQAKELFAGGYTNEVYGKVPIVYNEQFVNYQIAQTSCYTPECYGSNSGCKVGELTIPEKVTVYKDSLSEYQSLPNQTKMKIRVFNGDQNLCRVEYTDVVDINSPTNSKVNLICYTPDGKQIYFCEQFVLV